MMNENYSHYYSLLRKTAIEAGEKILEIRNDKLGVTIKNDNSPVTLADQTAEKIILRDLNIIAPEIPVIAEESASEGNIPDVKDKFWLVDPLDGTKEFIAGGTDFTVNIALIENGVPTFGIIYTPATRRLYTAVSQNEATLQIVDQQLKPGPEMNIRVRDGDINNLTALASKSHLDEETKAFLDDLNITDKTSAGSSMKFCVVAEGKADIYPRFGPTMEWDIAAGHAILSAAGGSVKNPDGTTFEYNKPGYRNGPFIARGNI
jgi:3'(2'), 5'-bisphosphate nucleotidase